MCCVAPHREFIKHKEKVITPGCLITMGSYGGICKMKRTNETMPDRCLVDQSTAFCSRKWSVEGGLSYDVVIVILLHVMLWDIC